MEEPRKILVVDDEQRNLLIMESMIVPLGHNVTCAMNGEQALEVVRRDPPDLILLDVMMPGLDGFSVCRMLKSDEDTRLIPIIIVSALNDVEDKVRALDCDADDFLSKPVNRHELMARLRSCLRIKTLNDRLESSESVLFAFARAVEAKDPYTIGHSERVAFFATELGKTVGLSVDQISDLKRGGLLHDVGKIGIPDAVLRKKGKLTTEEFEAIKSHTVIGEQICSPLRSFGGILNLVRSHHERLDGSGYPDGLTAESISTPVRILSIADVFDALTSDRPYRSSMSLEDVERIFSDEVERQRLDTDLVNAAREHFHSWLAVAQSNARDPWSLELDQDTEPEIDLPRR